MSLKLKFKPLLLLNALSIATRIINAKASMPVLSCVQLVGDKKSGRVHVTATNLDTTIATSFAAEIEDGGGVCIEGRRFQSIVAAVEGETGTLSVDKRSHVTLACGRSTFKLLGIPPDEFPKLTEMEGETTQLKFTQPALAAILKSVAEAQATDPTRYILNGVCLERPKGKQLFAVATDGRRLHLNNSDASEGAEKSTTIIVPTIAVDKVMSLLGESGDSTLEFDSRKLRVLITREEGDIVVLSKLVDGMFPNWQGIVKQFGGSEVVVIREELLNALSRASLALDPKYTAVRMKIEDALITLAAASPDAGEAQEILSCDNKAGAKAEIAMNINLLMEALRSVSSEKVTLHVQADSKAPLGIADGAGVKMIIMPVRIT